MSMHRMGPSPLNHGDGQWCEKCKASDREIRFALGPVCPISDERWETVLRESEERVTQQKIKVFGQHTTGVFNQAAEALPGCFVVMFVIGESDGLTIAQMRCNVEQPQAVLEHCRAMIDNALDESLATVDLRDVGGTEH